MTEISHFAFYEFCKTLHISRYVFNICNYYHSAAVSLNIKTESKWEFSISVAREMKIPRILLILVKHCLEQVVWSTKFNSDTSVPFPLKFGVTAFWWGWNPTNGKRGSSCIPRWQQLMLAARALTWSRLSPFWLHFCWKVRKMKLHRALHYNEKKKQLLKNTRWIVSN